VLSEIDPTYKGISKRQIFEDIAFMESGEGWQVELNRHKDGKKVFYRYLNTSFSINNMPLNEVEINQLQSAVDILSQFKGMPQFEWINELVPKLKQGIVSNEQTNTIIDFDSNQYLKGIEHLGPLYNAIFYKKVLCAVYQSFADDTPTEIVIHPYFLKQYNNRWFLFGYNSQKDKYDWNMALDRILAIKEINEIYRENKSIDWEEYFEDIIGVTKPIDGEVEDIELQFVGSTGKYIETKPLHGSQKARWISENILEVRLQLIINYEIERLILSYADSVKIIKPINLATKIKDRIKTAFDTIAD
jgi:predicted DNA-binding transcriptional regulator YafY